MFLNQDHKSTNHRTNRLGDLISFTMPLKRSNPHRKLDIPQRAEEIIRVFCPWNGLCPPSRHRMPDGPFWSVLYFAVWSTIEGPICYPFADIRSKRDCEDRRRSRRTMAVGHLSIGRISAQPGRDSSLTPRRSQVPSARSGNAP